MLLLLAEGSTARQGEEVHPADRSGGSESEGRGAGAGYGRRKWGVQWRKEDAVAALRSYTIPFCDDAVEYLKQGTPVAVQVVMKKVRATGGESLSGKRRKGNEKQGSQRKELDGRGEHRSEREFQNQSGEEEKRDDDAGGVEDWVAIADYVCDESISRTHLHTPSVSRFDHGICAQTRGHRPVQRDRETTMAATERGAQEGKGTMMAMTNGGGSISGVHSPTCPKVNQVSIPCLEKKENYQF